MTSPVLKAPGEGTALWHLDTLKTFTALSEETGGRLTAWEELLPHRSSPPLHVHTAADEAWFVLDGALTFQVADRTWTAEAGAFVWGPRGLPHTFRVDSPPPGCWAWRCRAGSTGSCGPRGARPAPRRSHRRRRRHRTWPSSSVPRASRASRSSARP